MGERSVKDALGRRLVYELYILSFLLFVKVTDDLPVATSCVLSSILLTHE